MTHTLYLAPAASGKTAHLVDLARKVARDPATPPRVIVPTRLQVRAWRERLALAGGALGVQVGTFDDLYREVLHSAEAVVTQLVDPVQVRLLRTVVDAASLTHYDAIRGTPGFIQVLRDLIGELKAGGVFPEALDAAVAAMGAPPRLMELAHLYAAYQLRLQEENWADYAGVGWLAAEALTRDPALAADWACVIVDGFDDLTTVQLRVLTELAGRVRRTIITLTGTPEGEVRNLVHRRFHRTRTRLEDALGVAARALPDTDAVCGSAPPLRHLERTLYTGQQGAIGAAGAVTMIAVPDREAEVRTALRWIKAHIVNQGMRPGQVALLARDIEPYRAFIVETATEYGLPIRVASGHALRNNPAIAALLDLLQLAAPGETYLAWRETVAAWRSPYFDWLHTYSALADAPLNITPEDAEALAWVARWGSVLGGFAQWEETFNLLCQASHNDARADESRDEDVPHAPESVPTGEAAEALWRKFRGFRDRIAPPEGEHSYRDFVTWLESLIGETRAPEEREELTSLGIARLAADGDPSLVERDLAALNTLKDVLRGLVWAEEAISCQPLTYAAFLEELIGAIDATTYRVPLLGDAEAVLAADVTQARGVSYRAVALLGLAEGEFPATLSEDPFLRNTDRTRLRDEFKLDIAPSPESWETQYFYEAITRPREALLLTRPRIADNGAPWQPSPFWEEVRRRLVIEPEERTSFTSLTPREAASWTELLMSVAAARHSGEAWTWLQSQQPAICERIACGQEVLAQRVQQAQGPFDGDLTSWATTFSRHLSPDRPWSASRLESYRRCPFSFFVGSILGLEPRQPPTEGLDARQLGNIYHHIFEELYNTVGPEPDRSALLEALSEVATRVLDAAPRTEQFRATAWWTMTRQEIMAHVRQSVEALEALDDEFAFYQAERKFGFSSDQDDGLVMRDEAGDHFRLRGLIDRVDRDAAGRIRIIDYKTAGPSSYTNTSVVRGDKLQLPLYALAAQDALGLGEVADGFYWHVQHAQASSFSLSRFYSDAGRGPRAAMEVVVALAWEAIRGARRGHFVPAVPDTGCPSYCPAASFCWHYEARLW
ncbi:MAG: PD-(D/E)XK nuclease family protein [Anaerolineae bacterium]